jgi:SAM-dependent methyltransferase
MGVGSIFMRVFGHPIALQAGDVDDPDYRIPVHRQLIRSKPLLYEGYLRWYRELMPAYHQTAHLDGALVEIGCGPGFLDELIPGLIKTDSVPNPFAHAIVDAMQMDYADRSLRAIFAVGVVHHLPHPERFLAEAQRCLQPGGRLALVEPSHHYPVPGFPRRLFTLLDHYEVFDDTVQDWDNEGASNMRGANIALPWVIFERDRARLEARFPSLRRVAVRYHSALSHVLAGGFSLRSIVPRPAIGPVFALEDALTSVWPTLGAMMTIDLERI